ncbi:MAG: alpha-glucoside transport system substrate-binding protein [Candidatus Aldehydirespiratoraceae bacterium]
MKQLTLAVALIIGAAILTGCGGDDDQAARPVVRIFGPYRGDEAALFTAGLDEWADSAGIDVRYTGSANFVEDLQYQVGDILSPPDIALVPQLGLVREMFRDGHIVPISDDTAEMLRRSYDEAALDLGRFDGTLIGFPYRANVKSLVWYRPEVLTSLSLTPPNTMTELESLVELIQEQGLTPWCLGIQAQLATGWPASDWVEDLILRQAGPDVYNDWVAGAVGFSDERIAEAFNTFRALVLEPGRVAGGVRKVLSTGTQESDDPLFNDPPGCVFFKQASFAYAWMPPGLEFGPARDIDFFLLPGADANTPAPVVAGTDLAVAFSDRPEVAAVLAQLSTPEAGHTWAQEGSYVSPRNDVDPASYYRPVDQAVAEVLLGAETLVFDGSDAMPPQIGTTLLWTQITAWISGQISYEQFAQTLDEARDG